MATNSPRNGQFGTSRNLPYLDGQFHPEPLYRTRRGRGRAVTRGVTTSSSALADALEGEELTPGGEGGEDGGQHEKIFSVTVPSMVTVPPTDEPILANRAEMERWDTSDKQLYSTLFLSIKSAANTFPVLFAESCDSRQQPDGQAALKAMADKYLHSSKQGRRVLKHKLKGMVMIPDQDPDEKITQVFQQQDEFEHIGESFTEARILYLILEGLQTSTSPSDSSPSGTLRSR